jgi:Tfp pilus assembly protein PilF
MAGLLARLSRMVRRDAGGVATTVVSAEPAAIGAQAMALYQAGRYAEAFAHYQSVLDGNPADFDALHMSGIIAQQTGDGERAVKFMQRAISVAPGNASVRNNLGLALHGLQQFEDAEASLRKAIELQPDWDRAYANLGIVLRSRGDIAGAEGAFANALRLNPANPEAMNNLANIWREARRYGEAERMYRSAIAIRPEAAEFWDNLGAVQLARERLDDAEQCFRSALALNGSMAQAHSNLGFTLLQLDRIDEAERSCRDALALRPDFPDALVNFASVLRRLGDVSGAEESLLRALAIDPRHAPAHTNLGSLRVEQGADVVAEASFREALRVDGNSPAARYNLAILQLKRGEYRDGFELFESRFDAFPHRMREEMIAVAATSGKDRWRSEPLNGRRLLVCTEQGYGDSLMMLRYLRLLKARGASELVILCEPELDRIFRATAGVDRVLTSPPDEASDTFDVYCPIMSLPYHFMTSADTVPADAPFFTVPPALEAAWQQRLSGLRGRRIGLAWAGSATLRDDAKRSIPLATFEPLREVEGIQLVSLQKERPFAEAALWDASPFDPMNLCDDFMDTAALIANLDLVISVDTAVVHLAGALGKPVWLLNRAESEWRWGLAGERSSWYPSMRIFRQQPGEGWDRVISGVADALAR